MSQDSGLSWAQPVGGLDRRYSMNVAADASQPDTWYAIVAPVLKAHSSDSQAILVRSSKGGPWQRLTTGLPEPFRQLPLLATDPVISGHVYLAKSNGTVWHSTDTGESWHQLPVHLGEIWFRLLVSTQDQGETQ